MSPGDTVDGRYVVRGVISMGSFGVVYRVRDEEADEDVALKTLHELAVGVPEHVARFEREARLGAELDHPNIVPHLRSGTLDLEHGGGPYLILALVQGLPLGDLIDHRGGLRVDEVVHILAGVLDALDAVHQLGAIHRDLKPDNILLAPRDQAAVAVDMDGSIAARVGVPEPEDPAWSDLSQSTVTLLDFGLGKFLPVGERSVRKLTRTGMSAGTLYYMSPEQVQGRKDVDYLADLYGAAMLLFRMLDGDPPYAGEPMIEVATKHLKAPPPDLPGDLNEAPIGRVYRRAAAKKRKDRYASAAEMAWSLRAAISAELAKTPPPIFKPPPEVRPTGLWARLAPLFKR